MGSIMTWGDKEAKYVEQKSMNGSEITYLWKELKTTNRWLNAILLVMTITTCLGAIVSGYVADHRDQIRRLRAQVVDMRLQLDAWQRTATLESIKVPTPLPENMPQPDPPVVFLPEN